MKKKLLSFVLALVLAIGLTISASATERAPSFGADIWGQGVRYLTNGISDPDAFLKETGLTLSRYEDVVYSPLSGLPNVRIKYGLTDSAGNTIFPAEFRRFESIGDGRIIGIKYSSLENMEYETGIYSTEGKVLYPPAPITIEYADESHNFLFTKSTGLNLKEEELAYLNTVTGMYNPNFNELLPMKYASIEYMEDGYYRITEGHKDSDGTCYSSSGVYKYGVGIVIPCQRDFGISYLGSDMFRVRTAPFCYGVIDGNGKQVLPAVYAGIRSYYDGYFAVSIFKNEQSRQLAIQTELPSADYEFHGYDLSDSEAYLSMGIVDKNGNAVTSFAHESASISESGLVQLGMWNGAHEWVWPLGNSGSFSTYKFWGKKYDYETIPAAELTFIEKNVSDLLRERGVAVSNTTNLPSTVGGFTDVKSNDYFTDAVLWAVEKKITSGTSKTTFSPGATCSKAQILTFLWRANGSPEPTAANPFTDIKPTDYFYKAALWAAEKGLLSGSAFGANTDCTRAMTVEYLWKAAGSPTPSAKASFTDVPANAEYAQAVAWAVENKITSGTGGGNFSPNATCTRGQIVTFLHRAMG